MGFGLPLLLWQNVARLFPLTTLRSIVVCFISLPRQVIELPIDPSTAFVSYSKYFEKRIRLIFISGCSSSARVSLDRVSCR